jgi:hypothetical protein
MTISFDNTYLLPESDDIVTDYSEAITLYLSKLYNVINNLTSYVPASEDVYNSFYKRIGEYIVVLIVEVVTP